MVFVTGGTGLLGTHLLIELSKRGKNIQALKRKSSKTEQVQKIFQYYFGAQWETYYSKVNWVEGDILNIPSLQKNIKNCDEIYHCAGYVSFKRKEYKKLLKINKEGTANLVNVALEFPNIKFCHVSSTAAIGRNQTADLYTEESKWINSSDNSNYAVSKYLAELEVWRGMEEGLNAVIVNPSVIFGVGDWSQSSLEIFNAVKKGLTYYTSGTNAFVDARDVSFCMAELMDRNVFNERFLTVSENKSFQELFTLMANKMGVKPPKKQVKKWMLSFAWRWEAIKYFIFKISPRITKETAKSAMSVSKYSNQKIKNALGVEFYTIEKSIENAVEFDLFVKK